MYKLITSACCVALLVAAATPAIAVIDGKTKGNGRCYDCTTGKHCGKGIDEGGATTTSGQGCECGTFSTGDPPEDPTDGFGDGATPLLGVDFFSDDFSAPITSVELPDVGDELFELHLWNGERFHFAAELGPNELFDFGPDGVSQFRVLGIDPELWIDPTNTNAFNPQINLFDGTQFSGLREEIVGVQVLGDANGDSRVDLLDLDILGSNFGTQGVSFGQGDFNEDGVVDLLDLDVLGSNFGSNAAGPTVAFATATGVPEPTALLLLGSAVGFAPAARRHDCL